MSSVSLAFTELMLCTLGISRIEKIQSVISTIHGIVAAQAANSHPALDSFTESFDALLHDFKDEYASLALDEVIVGAIGQVVR